MIKPKELFTTPCLDFKSHSTELLQLIEQVYVYRDTFWAKQQHPPSGTDLFMYKETKVEKRMEDVLLRFNLLTKRPLKKRALENGKNNKMETQF